MVFAVGEYEGGALVVEGVRPDVNLALAVWRPLTFRFGPKKEHFAFGGGGFAR